MKQALCRFKKRRKCPYSGGPDPEVFRFPVYALCSCCLLLELLGDPLQDGNI